MTRIKGNNVLITGGASGIGRIMGRISLEKGARTLVIWDINEENIAATVKEFKQLGNVKGYKVDVSDSKQVVDMATATRKIRFCQALLPNSVFDYIFGEVVGIFHAMDHFTGRQKKTK